LSPLISKDSVDAVTTNSIKGAFYLKNSNGVGVNLKPLLQIVEDETR
jgi:predicted aconitase